MVYLFIFFVFLPPPVRPEVVFKVGTHNGRYAKLTNSVALPMGSACSVHIFSSLLGRQIHAQIHAPSLLFYPSSGLTVCHASAVTC